MRRSLIVLSISGFIVVSAVIGWPAASFAWQSDGGAMLASVEPSYLQL